MRGLHIGVKTVGLNERLGVESLIKDDDARLGLLNGEAEEVTEQALVFEAPGVRGTRDRGRTAVSAVLLMPLARRAGPCLLYTSPSPRDS